MVTPSRRRVKPGCAHSPPLHPPQRSDPPSPRPGRGWIVARRLCSQAIDRFPLQKGERKLFEVTLYATPGLTATPAHVLRALLDEWFWGRADCYPSAERIAEKTHLSVSSVKRALATLERIGIIVRVRDWSILPEQRRIILASH